MMSKLISFMLVLMMCTGCARSKIETINMAGSTAFQPFAEKLAEVYMAKNPNIQINVQGGGSAVGIQSAESGVAQIGMVDLVTLSESAEGLNTVVIARDAIALIVHPTNKIDNLSTEQIQQIFIGKIKNWQEVGGGNKSITIVSREEGSGTRDSFEDLVIGEAKINPYALIQDSNGAVKVMVENDPNAIGYLTYGCVTPKVKAVQIDGIAPTPQNIKEGKYKIIRPIFLLTKEEPSLNVQEFINFMLSQEAQQIIADNGLIPIR